MTPDRDHSFVSVHNSKYINCAIKIYLDLEDHPIPMPQPLHVLSAYAVLQLKKQLISECHKNKKGTDDQSYRKLKSIF